tara:strand:+ start:664 stop:807 length:144 start_codon:yes stop_codon:yes gene_type:complete
MIVDKLNIARFEVHGQVNVWFIENFVKYIQRLYVIYIGRWSVIKATS